MNQCDIITKIRSIIEYLQNKFKTVFQNGIFLWIKSIMAWKGRLMFKSYDLGKPENIMVYKFYKVAEAINGWMCLVF